LKLLRRYAAQRLHAHRGTSLVLGNALAARLLKSARDLGVEIAVNASVRDVLLRDGRATGVRIAVGGGERELHAVDAVVLATGGISHHGDLRQAYVPAAAGGLSATVRSGAERGGVHLARALGARLSAPAECIEDALAFWVPASSFRRADGSEALFPHTVTDRAKPGLIAVDGEGKRFVNEAVSYHEFVRAQLRDPSRRIPAWLVCDSPFLWKYGLGRVRPFALSVREERGSGYLRTAGTLEGLARAIGVPSAALVETVRAYNEGARRGEDAAFGRGSDIYQRHMGDAEQRPNPCVAPVERGPYYAVAVQPADLGMAAGIVTNADAQVLRSDGKPIPGLYACGNDMHSVMNGSYPGPGITLGPALVFGYLAAKHATSAR
jgi:succinate dehydrogenase/fumarate reductase flavoprotein subunit